MKKSNFINSNLEGEDFFWAGNSIGVLLIHGFTATTAEVRPLARVLHNAGYTVAGPLLPGHKTTPQELNKISWQDWVSKIEVTYQHMKEKCKTVLVGGESMGGLLSLYMAIHKPEILGLLLFAPALKLTLRPIDRFQLTLLAPFIPWVTPLQNAKKSIVDERWQGYSVRPLKGLIQLLKLQEEVLLDLGKIQQPVLICQGRLDSTVHPCVPDIIYRSVQSKTKEIRWFENSTHCVILDSEFEDVAQSTLKFIEQTLNEHNQIH